MREASYTFPEQWRKVIKFYGKPLLNYRGGIIVSSGLLTIILTCYFTYLTLTWTGVRFNVIFHADYIEIASPTAETSEVFKDLRPGDRIIAIDNIAVNQFLQKGVYGGRLLIYPSQNEADELSIAGDRLQPPYQQDKPVLLWSILAKTLTVDTNYRPQKPLSNSIITAQTNSISPGENSTSGTLILNLDDVNFNTDRDVLTIVLLTSALFFCGMGLLFYILQPSTITTVYALLNFLISLELIVSSIDRSYIETLEKVVIIFGAMIGPTFLHFMLLFPGDKPLAWRSKVLAFSFYLIVAVLVTLRLYSVLGLDTAEMFAVENVARRLSRISLLVTCTLGLVALAYGYLQSKGRERTRIRLTVFAFALATIVPFLAVAYYVIVSLWQPVVYTRFGLFFLPSAVAPPLVGYAILRNQLLGIKVRGFVLHVALIILTWAVYIAISTLVSWILPLWREFSREPAIVAFILSILTALLYKMRYQLQGLIDHLFKVDPLDYTMLNQSWNARLITTVELGKILSQVIYELPRDYHYKDAALLIWNPVIGEMLAVEYPQGTGQVASLLVFAQGSKESNSTACLPKFTTNSFCDNPNQLEFWPVECDPQFRLFFQQQPYVLSSSEVLPASVKAQIECFALPEVEVLLPLRLGTELYGLLLIGQKAIEYLPTEWELLHLSTLASQIAVALHKAALLETEKVLRDIYEQSLGREEQAREQERLKIAGLLHEDILQQMLAMKRSIERLLNSPGNESTHQQLSENLATIKAVTISLRDMNASLVPSQLKHDLLGAIKEFLHEKQVKHSDISFNFELVDGEPFLIEKLLDVELKVALYRFVEETVNNALRHAKASIISVSLLVYPTGTSSAMTNYFLRLAVSDDGVGLPQYKLDNLEQLLRQRHFGLSTIKRRFEFYHGKVEFCSTPGEGLQVEVILPLTLTIPTGRPSFDNLLRTRN